MFYSEDKELNMILPESGIFHIGIYEFLKSVTSTELLVKPSELKECTLFLRNLENGVPLNPKSIKTVISIFYKQVTYLNIRTFQVRRNSLVTFFPRIDVLLPIINKVPPYDLNESQDFNIEKITAYFPTLPISEATIKGLEFSCPKFVLNILDNVITNTINTHEILKEGDILA